MAQYGTVEYEAEVAKVRTELEARYGQVWNTAEVQQDFQIISFLAPSVDVIKLDTGEAGILWFKHSPRFYYNFQPNRK